MAGAFFAGVFLAGVFFAGADFAAGAFFADALPRCGSCHGRLMGITDKLCPIPFPTVKHGEDGGSKAVRVVSVPTARARLPQNVAAVRLGVYLCLPGRGRDSQRAAKLTCRFQGIIR